MAVCRMQEGPEEIMCDAYVEVWQQARAYESRRGPAA
jgi:hypothetical protein